MTDDEPSTADETQVTPADATEVVAVPAAIPAAPPAAAPPAAAPPAAAPPAPPPTYVAYAPPPRSLLLRAIWFLLVGWWLSGVAITVAYFFCVTIIGLPVGFWIFNRLPLILTLRERTGTTTTEVRDGITYVVNRNVEQYPMVARALWFILVGWWLGAFYLALAWGLCVLIITLPIGLWLFNRVGAVMTLLRY